MGAPKVMPMYEFWCFQCRTNIEMDVDEDKKDAPYYHECLYTDPQGVVLDGELRTKLERVIPPQERGLH